MAGNFKKSSKNGDIYIADVTVVAIVDTHNNIEEFVALMMDVTEVYEKFEGLSLNLQQDLASQQHYHNEYERAIELGTSCARYTRNRVELGSSAPHGYGRAEDPTSKKV
ncbi:MAG: hypothetical protein GQ581_10365 [Methyloprofundus sp.]|nr:hypothetical protein [Methyloprofundus sp.]